MTTPPIVELETLWAAASARPATGTVSLVVVRLGGGAHDTPPRLQVSPEGGVHGDRWSQGEARDPDDQVSLIDRRVADVLVGDDPARLHVPGDNVVVDLDLDVASLPVGTRLCVGSAVIEVTAKPHRGCVKFRDRLGDEALRWISDPAHRDRRLRGVYARVVAAGEIAIGDRVTPAGAAIHGTVGV